MSAAFRPAALLLHSVPGHPSHFDLLLSLVEHPAPEDRCALGWRATTAIHALLPDHGAPLEPAACHRGLYLSLEAPRDLEGDRGRVEPLVHGRWRPLDRSLAELSWNPHAPSWSVRFSAEGRPVDPSDDAAMARATRIERVR